MTPEQIKEVADALAEAEGFFRRVTEADLPGQLAFTSFCEIKLTREDDDAWRAIRRARRILDQANGGSR